MIQLLPTKFCLGELYRNEGAIRQSPSAVWARPDKTHNPFGSRLIQQIIKHVTCDAGLGLNLLCKAAPRDHSGRQGIILLTDDREEAT